MRHRPSHRLAPAPTHPTRLAWWVAFLATVALIGILNFVRSADAAVLPAAGGGAPAALGEFGFDEEGEEELEEGEACSAEAEEGEECGEEGESEGKEAAPEECGLSQTDAEVTLSPHGTMRLTIRYTAPAPTLVAIEYRSQGPRGSLKADGDRRRLAGAGSFRETEHLDPSETARALAAKSFTVQLRPLGAPRYCHAYFDHSLTVRRQTAHGRVWLDPETTFRVPGRI